MTKDEALKLLLEALEINLVFLKNVKPFKGQEDLASDCVLMSEETITAIKEDLAKEKALQALHDENERLGLYKDAYAQLEECNFCPRCGKRNKDIHTCTPPQE